MHEKTVYEDEQIKLTKTEWYYTIEIDREYDKIVHFHIPPEGQWGLNVRTGDQHDYISMGREKIGQVDVTYVDYLKVGEDNKLQAEDELFYSIKKNQWFDRYTNLLLFVKSLPKAVLLTADDEYIRSLGVDQLEKNT